MRQSNENNIDEGESLREFCCFGELDKIESLLQRSSVDINSQNKVNGWTALHWAAKRGYLDICQLLLANGASTNIPNFNHQLPVDCVSQNDRRLIHLLASSSSTHIPSIVSEIPTSIHASSHLSESPDSERKSTEIEVQSDSHYPNKPKCAVSCYNSLNRQQDKKIKLSESDCRDYKATEDRYDSESETRLDENYSTEKDPVDLEDPNIECSKEQELDVSDSTSTTMQPQQPSSQSVGLVPAYMSRIKPPNSAALSSYAEDYTYPWTKPNSKNSTPSSTGSSGGNRGALLSNGLSSSAHHINSSISMNNSPQLHNTPNNSSSNSHHVNEATLPHTGLRISHHRSHLSQSLLAAHVASSAPNNNDNNPDISVDSGTTEDILNQPSSLLSLGEINSVGPDNFARSSGGVVGSNNNNSNNNSSVANLFSSNESMPIVAASSEVQFYMDRAGGAGGGGGGERDCSNKESKAVTSHHNHSSHHSGGGTAGGSGAGYRILKVRVSDQCDKDFVEIDLPTDKLSIQGFLEVSCQELGLEYPVHIERIRKMPNTRLRRDIEVQRLHNYQELELVLSKHPVALPAPHHHHPSSSSAHPHPLSHSHSYLNSVNNPSGSPRTTTTDMVL